jgi:2-iminobutanoate/2-iminopropanoate deaminase
MSRQIIRTDRAPASGAFYSQAVRVGNHVYVSGSGPFDPKTKALVPGGIEAQTARTLDNLSAILDEAGCSMADIVKITIYLKDIRDFNALNSVYQKYFPENPPARTCVQAISVGEGRLLVIDAEACIDR